MTYYTGKTETYSMRLPAPSLIRGALALHAPHDFDLACLAPGYQLTKKVFDLPLESEHLVDATVKREVDVFTVQAVVVASPSRAYVLLLTAPWKGWWRIDTVVCDQPDRSQVLGELTPLPFCGIYSAIKAEDLRVDDVIYVSGIPNGRTQVRVLDLVVGSSDGRGEYVLIRTSYGWFLWRHSFIHVATL
jgi:hypothetical protein